MPRPVIIHQSDLGSWNYCPRRMKYENEGRVEHTNSRLAYGTVLHHAIHVFERFGDLDKATATFLHYWHPLNIDALTAPVPRDGWFGRDTYGEMRKRGVEALQRYAELKRYDEHEVLGFEFDFVVPVQGLVVPFLGEEREVYLAGTVDRLAVRWYRQRETVCIDDWKTGQQKWNLRDNLQGTAYAYASLQEEFFLGAEVEGVRLGSAHGTKAGEVKRYSSKGFSHQQPLNDEFETRAHELIHRFDSGAPRRFTWINLKTVKIVDGGYRGPQDFGRLKEAIVDVTRSVDAGIYPLRIDGETCRYCTFRRTCGGTGVPDPEHGDPAFHFAPLFKD